MYRTVFLILLFSLLLVLVTATTPMTNNKYLLCDGFTPPEPAKLTMGNSEGLALTIAFWFDLEVEGLFLLGVLSLGLLCLCKTLIEAYHSSQGVFGSEAESEHDTEFVFEAGVESEQDRFELGSPSPNRASFSVDSWKAPNEQDPVGPFSAGHSNGQSSLSRLARFNGHIPCNQRREPPQSPNSAAFSRQGRATVRQVSIHTDPGRCFA